MSAVIVHKPQGEIVLLPLDILVPGSMQPRTIRDPEKTADLHGSIKASGVKQPIFVRAINHGLQYEIVDGHNRVDGARAAEHTEIPALVLALSDTEALEIALIQGVQHATLHPLDEANGYKRLMDMERLKPARVAERLGQRLDHISRRLQLTRLIDEAQDALRDGSIDVSHAQVIAGEGKADQRTILEYVLKKNPTLAQLKSWVEKLLGGPLADGDADGEESEGNGAKEAKPERTPHAVTPKMIESFALSVGKIKAKDIAASEPLQAALRKLAENAGRALIAGARAKPPKEKPAAKAKRKAAPRKK
jgi:ParB family chromosome partitioning protein